MPLGLLFALVFAVLGGYVVHRGAEQGRINLAFLVLVATFVVTMIAREIDAGFWAALWLRL